MTYSAIEQTTPGIPPKFQAAMEYIRFCEQKESGASCGFGDAPKDNGRELSKMEKDVYESALVVVLEYFNEPGWGDSISHPPQNPDDPKETERVSA